MSDAPLPDPTPSRSAAVIGHVRGIVQRYRPLGADWALGLPVLAAALWLAGYQGPAMAFALVLPALLLVTGRGLRRRPAWDSSVTRLTKSQAEDLASAILKECRLRGFGTVALVAKLERPALYGVDWDGALGEQALQTIAGRVAASLREVDAAFTLGDDKIVALLSPMRRTDLDILMSIADRMQAAIGEPLALHERTVQVGCRIGLCSDKMAAQPTGKALLSGANTALIEAERHETGAVRAFTREMQERSETGHKLALQVSAAIAKGQVRAWFQPQIDAKTGRLSGFEALARWHHPDLGVLTPGDFLSAIHAAGEDAALGKRMLQDALQALKSWDEAGLKVDQVGLNFSLQELRDPRLAERVIWEVDRAGQPAHRIAVEILENVTLENAEETIIRNVSALKSAGMRLDLDDFGTGAASIGNIARFGVHRIKIDRSFVRDIESSEKKHRTLSAILSMAAEMGIETLAEGVETQSQLEQLCDLGCTHLQGFAIARPMPLDDTLVWAKAAHPGSQDLALLRPQGSA